MKHAMKHRTAKRDLVLAHYGGGGHCQLCGTRSSACIGNRVTADCVVLCRACITAIGADVALEVDVS